LVLGYDVKDIVVISVVLEDGEVVGVSFFFHVLGPLLEAILD
jgi:hypothetical protein